MDGPSRATALCARSQSILTVRIATSCHRPVGAQEETASAGWLPEGPLTVGLTAGASTPNNVVGQVIERILALRGEKAEDLVAG